MFVLFDTNVASYWMSGNPKFRFRLKVLYAELQQKKATLVLSVVSLQEILAYSRAVGSTEADYTFLAERFNFVPFDEPCAKEAARLAALVGHPNSRAERKRRGRNATRLERDIWHRDAALAGTVEYHGHDMLVTSDGPLAHKFANFMTKCEIRLIEEDPAPSAPTTTDEASSNETPS